MTAGAPNLPPAELLDGYEDKPQDECGVWGVYAPGMPVTAISYDALGALQHRGQSGAGVFVYMPGGEPVGTKGNGLVPVALRGAEPPVPGAASTFDTYGSAIAVGHVRYSTSSSNNFNGNQPFGDADTGVVTSHNGTLSGLEPLMLEYGIDPKDCETDSHANSLIISAAVKRFGDVETALDEVLPQLDGAYCFVISDGKKLYGVRDPWGYHPLSIGVLPDGAGYVLSSEQIAYRAADAVHLRDVEPGEIVTIGEHGISTTRIQRQERRAACLYEQIYTAHPGGEVDGSNVYVARSNMGRFLAEDNPVEADIVVAVPESGRSAADGYAEAAGIPVVEGLFKNTYSQRSFILRSEARAAMLRNKFVPNRAALEGQRVVLVDDSLIKGNTMQALVGAVREAGASEIHVRLTAPPYLYPCYMGMDTGDPHELIARTMTDDEIATYIGADSVAFNTVERVEQAIVEAAVTPNETSLRMGQFCTACATGEYPSPANIPVLLGMPVMRRYVTVS